MTKIKTFHIHAGLDLIGSKTSMAASSNTTLGLAYDENGHAYGVEARSKKSNRIIVVPFTNIKGMELLESSTPEEVKKSPGRPKTNNA